MSMSIGNLFSSPLSQLYGMFGADQGAGGSSEPMRQLAAQVKQAQNGGLDKASIVREMLETLPNSDDPAIAQIGKDLKRVDDRIGGPLNDRKLDYLLKQLSTLLNIGQGGDGGKSTNAGSFHF